MLSDLLKIIQLASVGARIHIHKDYSSHEELSEKHNSKLAKLQFPLCLYFHTFPHGFSSNHIWQKAA